MSEEQIPSKLEEQFRTLFGSRPRIFRAPGRVNLIGEHTDYNDGFVMPAAIDFAVCVAVAPRNDRRVVVNSTNFQQRTEFDLDNDFARPQNHWSDYIHGVGIMLGRAGHRLRGANLLVSGDIPIGAGLSSSAAIEVASACALLGISGLSMDSFEMVKLCRKAENEFVGVACGIMDQFISVFGRTGRALMLDCRSLAFELLPLPPSVSLVICNTMVKHELGSSEYNTRRAQCEEGVRTLSRFSPDIRALRDVSLEQLEQYRGELPELVYRRCRHVVSENIRVEQAAVALKKGDLGSFGDLMGESHRSLRDDYEVSCHELDLMVNSAVEQPGVYGARMTGGGFGGCTINLVRNDAFDQFRTSVSSRYRESTGFDPQIFVSSAAEGAREISLSS